MGLILAVVDHAIANKQCRERMGQAYALNKEAGGQPKKEQVDALYDRLEKEFPVVDNQTSGAPPEPAPKKTVKVALKAKAKAEPLSKRQRKLTDYKK